MRNIFKHYAIIYWSKKVKKYNDLAKLFIEDIEGIDYIYTTGLLVTKRDNCLRCIEILEKRK